MLKGSIKNTQPYGSNSLPLHPEHLYMVLHAIHHGALASVFILEQIVIVVKLSTSGLRFVVTATGQTKNMDNKATWGQFNM